MMVTTLNTQKNDLHFIDCDIVKKAWPFTSKKVDLFEDAR
jgi:hypothetical protein